MENTKLFLVKEGEISLKGANRSQFEDKLKNNIKHKLRPYHSTIKRQKGRLFIYIDSSCPSESAEFALKTTFGVTGYAEAFKTEKDINKILEKVREILPQSTFSDKGSFKVHVVREDKNFPLSSKDVAIKAAEIVHEFFPSLTVDLKHPNHTLYIEIRSEVYIYTSEKKGCGGLPAGTAGNGLLLLSGGIDSPVAALLTAKRGLKLQCVYFHAYPYTSEEALEKVKTLASIISPYLQGTTLYVVSFTKGQEYIRDNGYQAEATLMFRASMVKIAQKIAEKTEAKALVTGEALSQVASQTLDAMAFTDSMTNKLVLRPLVGMDKEEIITKAKEYGTYETSILPYEDSCVVFAPKHPVTRPKLGLTKEHFDSLNMESFIEEAVNTAKVYSFNTKGELIESENIS